MDLVLPAVAGFVALVSLILAPKAQSEGAFFQGLSPAGRAPGLLTLIFSQVTTWIFARSLMNAAILGFYYGLWGTLAYAIYYLSFITGGLIIDDLRFRKGYNSIQSFLRDRFGLWGTRCYNLVIGVRLISEVFANLLVIGILFGAAGSSAYTLAVVAMAGAALLYSMLGGLHASLRTDLFQMVVFLLVLGLLIALTIFDGHFTLQNLFFTPF
ncbi:MAG: sodium:proline symporter, partial [Candidatus Thiodiazotropha sp. (ex Semelilucina semeliformis)]|nr:sodium:proline symporter [Candidatus Thiodiazotropha sp. (ex Semelilucina semeliformis)]